MAKLTMRELMERDVPRKEDVVDVLAQLKEADVPVEELYTNLITLAEDVTRAGKVREASNIRKFVRAVKAHLDPP